MRATHASPTLFFIYLTLSERHLVACLECTAGHRSRATAAYACAWPFWKSQRRHAAVGHILRSGFQMVERKPRPMIANWAKQLLS